MLHVSCFAFAGTIDGNVTANVNEGNIDAHITQHHVSQLRTNKGEAYTYL